MVESFKPKRSRLFLGHVLPPTSHSVKWKLSCVRSLWTNLMKKKLRSFLESRNEKSCSMFFSFCCHLWENSGFPSEQLPHKHWSKIFCQLFQLNFSFDCSDTTALVEKGIFLSFDQGWALKLSFKLSLSLGHRFTKLWIFVQHRRNYFAKRP